MDKSNPKKTHLRKAQQTENNTVESTLPNKMSEILNTKKAEWE